MKKQKPIILQIPKPCTETWAEMKPMGLGRFCAHCQKTVTDISQMSDSTIAQLFANNKEGICVRAFASQLNRPLQFSVQTPTRFYRIAIALGLTILIANTAETNARPRPPLVEQNYLLRTDDSTKRETATGDSISIKGVVLDETGAPFAGVIVKVKLEGIVKGGEVADDDGSFNIYPLKKLEEGRYYDVEFSSMGYKTLIITGINCNATLNKKMQVIDTEWLVGLVDRFEPTIIEKPGQKTFNEDDLKKMGY